MMYGSPVSRTSDGMYGDFQLIVVILEIQRNIAPFILILRQFDHQALRISLAVKIAAYFERYVFRPGRIPLVHELRDIA